MVRTGVAWPTTPCITSLLAHEHADGVTNPCRCCVRATRKKISRCNCDRHAIITDDGDARDACAACIVEIFFLVTCAENFSAR